MKKMFDRYFNELCSLLFALMVAFFVTAISVIRYNLWHWGTFWIVLLAAFLCSIAYRSYRKWCLEDYGEDHEEGDPTY